MKWLQIVGCILLLGGLASAIPTYNASQTKSRLYSEASLLQSQAMMDGGTRFPDAARRVGDVVASSKAADAAHSRWLAIMFGCTGAGVVTLTGSLLATRLLRRKPRESNSNSSD